jgi:hypothetical protein
MPMQTILAPLFKSASEEKHYMFVGFWPQFCNRSQFGCSAPHSLGTGSDESHETFQLKRENVQS